MRTSAAPHPGGGRESWIPTWRPPCGGRCDSRSRMSLGRAPATVTLQDSDGTTLASIGKGPQCAIRGAAPELLLFLSGRDAVQIEFDGDDDTVEQVREARRAL